MNKKFFGALVFGALMTASTGTFVSCTDYDDDIKNLQEQIDKLAGKAELESQVSNLSSQISAAQGAADAAKTAAAAAQAAADAAKSVADSKLDEAAVKAIADAAAEGAAAAAKEGKDAAAVAQAAAEAAQAAAAAAQATADKGVSAAEAAQATADAAAEAAQAVAAKLADYATKAELKAAQEVAAAAAAAAAEEGKAAAKIAADAAAAAQKTADEAVAAAKKAAEDAAAAKKAGIEAAAEAEKKAAEAQKTADAAVAAAKKAQETADKVAAAQAAADAAQKTADAAKTVADKAATDIIALDARVKSIETSLKALLTEDGLKNLMELVDKLNEDSAEFLTIVSNRLTSLVFAPQTYIDGIETINFATFRYYDWGTAEANWLRDDAGDKKVNENNEYIEVSKDTEGAISVTVNGETKYYAPVDKIIIGDNSTTAQYLVSPAGVTLDGIKELSFIAQNEATNQTRAIGAAPIKVVGKDLKDGILTLKLAKTDVSNTLGDGYEDSRYNPKKFTTVSLKATLADTVLTAAEKDAEVNVFSDWTRLTESTIRPFIANNEARDDKGELDCSWGCNSYFKHNSHFAEFTAMYHRQDPTTGDRVNQVYDTEGTKNKYNHYSASPSVYAKEHIYSEPIDLLSLVTVCAGPGRYNNNEIKNYKDYGLKFEFNLMKHFYVKNQNQTQDNTDQQLFAKLDADGHTLIATSRDGQEKNADAVGRTPVIQVVLKDTVNNAVVDVRYFKVLWTESQPISTVWHEANELANDGFECTGTYETYILEKYMNNMYANIVPGGITKDKFHGNRYIWTTWINNNLSYSFFAYSYTEKVNGENVTHEFDIDSIKSMLDEGKYDVLDYLGFGNVYDLYDAGQNRTHNLKIEVNADDYRLPQTEQDFTINGWFFFQSYDGYSRVIIPVTFDVKKGTIVNKYNYLETQWQGTLTVENADKTRPTNPTLISDKQLGGSYKGTTYSTYETTQLICDITYGYMSGSKTPEDFLSLAGYKSATWKDGDAIDVVPTDVVFDGARLSILPSLDDLTWTDPAKKVHTYGWAITENGKTLYYAEKDDKNKVKSVNDATAVIAAQVDATGSGDKRVFLCDTKSNTNTTTGADKTTAIPTVAALRLVGQKVPVKVTATRCNTVDFDKYLIWFIDPLKWTDGSQAIKLKDVLNEGDAKEISVGTQFTLQENFGSKTQLYLFDVLKSDGTVLHAKTTELNDWYGIENIVMSAKSEWLINIDANGVINDNSSSKLTQVLKGGTTTPIYDLQLLNASKAETTDLSQVKYVKYHNNSGQAITKNIVIKVPVSLDTKWKKGNKNYITVTIEPNI